MLFLSLTGRAHQFEHVPTSDAKVQTQTDAHLWTSQFTCSRTRTRRSCANISHSVSSSLPLPSPIILLATSCSSKKCTVCYRHSHRTHCKLARNSNILGTLTLLMLQRPYFGLLAVWHSSRKKLSAVQYYVCLPD
jgi:hypothetical protein